MRFVFEVVERVNVGVELSIVGRISEGRYWGEWEGEIGKLGEDVRVK